jgi:hypothetical protein
MNPSSLDKLSDEALRFLKELASVIDRTKAGTSQNATFLDELKKEAHRRKRQGSINHQP